MYKIYLSTFSPFWNNSDINYPDFEKFDTQDIFNFESTSWVEIPNGTIQWIQSNSAWVQIDPQTYSINYLGVLDTHTNKKYYFFVIDEFDRTINTVKLNLELDNWLTYGKNMLDKLKENNAPVYFNKKHMNRYAIVDNFQQDETVTSQVDITNTYYYEKELNKLDSYIYISFGFQGRFGHVDIERDNQTITNFEPAPDFSKRLIYSNGEKSVFSTQVNYPNAISPSRTIENYYSVNSFQSEIIAIINNTNSFLNENQITDTGTTITISYNTANADINCYILYGLGERTSSKPLVLSFMSWPERVKITTNGSATFPFRTFDYKDGELRVASKFINSRGNITRTDGDWYLGYGIGKKYEELATEFVSTLSFNWGELLTVPPFFYYYGGVWPIASGPTFENDKKLISITISVNIKGTKKETNIVPQATTYNMNLQTTQQHLLNECDFSEYGNNKINLNKQNYKIPPYKNAYVDQLYSRSEPVWRHQWLPNDDEFFDIGNGYYLYGVVKYPLTPTELDQNMVKFLGNNISSTLNVFFPITVKPMENNALFKYNTKGLIESSFGDLLTGIIASPISPTSLSTKCINAKTLFNKPPYNPTTIYHQMSGFALNAFELKQFQESSKTPYGGEMFKPFTPPTTEAEKWNKKLTTLDWRNETLLLAPQFLQYYLTNGTNQININNFVNSQLTDKNYMYFSWALTPLTCILYIGGLFDVNRFETQKNIITYSGSIPANSASYNQWVLNNSASINMGLESAKANRDLDIKHAKQNQVMGALNSVAGIAAGIAGGKGFGAAMGIQGVMQGFNQAHQAKQSIEKADLTYKNYQSTIAGANLDAQTHTTSISSDDATYINTFAALSPLSMIYKGLKVSDCQAIWYSCLLSGYNVNNVYNFNEYDNRTFYNYLKVTDIAGQVLQAPNTPLEYKEWFISKLTSGVRLWKTNMNYQLDNKENFIDRIDNAIIPIPPTTPQTPISVKTIKKGKKKNGK